MIDLSSFENYLNNSAFSPKTKETYLSCLKHYSTVFDDITNENVEKYKRQCLKIHSPNTVNLRLHAISKYAEYFKIPVNFSYVKIQEPLFSETMLTEKDYNRLMNYFFGKREYEWYILFRLLAATGIRLAESKQIKYSDLKSAKKVIIGKGTKTRMVWFPYCFRKDIAPLLKEFELEDYVVKHDDSYIRKKLKIVQVKLKIKGRLSPHEFRRFYARKIYARTKDVQLVKDLLGHSSIKTTLRYDFLH